MLDQSDRKTEFDMLKADDVAEAYRNYDKKMGSGFPGAEPATPHPEMEPTTEQLSALAGVIQAGSVPYVDFAIWGPFGNRLRRKLAFEGYSLGPNGEVHVKELKGPSSFDEWRASYNIFKTAMIMLDAASPQALDGYMEHVRRLGSMFGPRCWLLLYRQTSG